MLAVHVKIMEITREDIVLPVNIIKHITKVHTILIMVSAIMIHSAIAVTIIKKKLAEMVIVMAMETKKSGVLNVKHIIQLVHIIAQRNKL